MKNFRQQQARPKKSALIIGRKAVAEALRSGQMPDRVYIDNQVKGQDINEIKSLASSQGVPVNYVPAAKLNAFHITDHEGCVALKTRVRYQQLQDIISQVTDRGEAHLFLLLDGITDIRNIGGIARTAWCSGVHSIIIPDKGVGALNEDAILTSAGALEKIPVCRVTSLMKAVDDLHMNGITVYAAEMTGAKNVGDTDLAAPVAIVLGSEEKGIYPALLKICDDRIRIPMANEFESLNVSVAAGIILYEAMKQRLA